MRTVVVPNPKSVKMKSRSLRTLPGDSHDIVPLSRYEVLKSAVSPSGFRYVTKAKNKVDWWQAQPYCQGVIKGDRWHAGNWSTPWLAAKAVAIATTHRCGPRKVEELMTLIDEDCYKIV